MPARDGSVAHAAAAGVAAAAHTAAGTLPTCCAASPTTRVGTPQAEASSAGVDGTVAHWVPLGHAGPTLDVLGHLEAKAGHRFLVATHPIALGSEASGMVQAGHSAQRESTREPAAGRPADLQRGCGSVGSAPGVGALQGSENADDASQRWSG